MKGLLSSCVGFVQQPGVGLSISYGDSNTFVPPGDGGTTSVLFSLPGLREMLLP